MPRLTIPINSKIDQIDQNRIEIKVRNTSFWIQGEKISKNLWNAYLANPQINYREIVRENVTTKSFAMFSNIILKTPFPYSGKRTVQPSDIIKFVKQITQTHEPNRTT